MTIILIRNNGRIKSEFDVEIESQSFGSGVVVGDGDWIVTNDHVVGGSKSVDVVVEPGRVLKGDVIASYRSFDLAFVRINEKLDALRLSPEYPPVGSSVVAVGYPYGLAPQPFFNFSSPARIQSSIIMYRVYRDVHTGSYFEGIFIKDVLHPGMSGGALVLDDNNTVVGIIRSIVQTFSGLGVPGFFAFYLLRELQGGNIPREVEWGLGVRMSSAFEVFRGLKVVSVNPTSTFYSILQPGDYIVGINNFIVDTIPKLRLVLMINYGKRVKVRFVRGGRELEGDVVVREVGGD